LTLKELQGQSRWLLRHASNVTSQCGEDGIIAKALESLPSRNSWCIEFGAWDGCFSSNTYSLVTKGYRGVFIEADATRFKSLQSTHPGQILINATVGYSETDSLDAILGGRGIPDDVDLLSIDIDGNDYYAWAAIQLRPKIVVIEFNPTIANAVRFVQGRGPINQGASAAALVDLGKTKGYELISATSLNLIFVDSRYYPLFGIPDNSLAVMRDDSTVPHIFVGYDGRIFLTENGSTGGIALPWHGLTLRESAVQRLPGFLRKHPPNYTRFDRFCLRLLSGGVRPWLRERIGVLLKG